MRRATYVVLLVTFLIAALFIAYRLRQPAGKAGMAGMAMIAEGADAWP